MFNRKLKKENEELREEISHVRSELEKYKNGDKLIWLSLSEKTIDELKANKKVITSAGINGVQRKLEIEIF